MGWFEAVSFSLVPPGLETVGAQSGLAEKILKMAAFERYIRTLPASFDPYTNF